MALPQIAAIVVLALSGYHLFKPASVKATEAAVGTCQGTHCSQIYVDRPVNTLMRDDRTTMTASLQNQLEATYRKSKNTYAAEASEHPGVHLVAHAVV